MAGEDESFSKLACALSVTNGLPLCSESPSLPLFLCFASPLLHTNHSGDHARNALPSSGRILSIPHALSAIRDGERAREVKRASARVEEKGADRRANANATASITTITRAIVYEWRCSVRLLKSVRAKFIDSSVLSSPLKNRILSDQNENKTLLRSKLLRN